MNGNETRETIENLLTDYMTEHGPNILKSEVQKAIHQSKARKSPEPDEIPIELVKLLNDESISVLTAFFNRGNFPATGRNRSSSPYPKTTKLTSAMTSD